MKKFKGLIIPDNIEEINIEDYCNAVYEYLGCSYFMCDKCLMNYPDKYNYWLELGRPCEICEDEE